MGRKIGWLFLGGAVVFITTATFSSLFIDSNILELRGNQFSWLIGALMIILMLLSLVLSGVLYWLFETFITEGAINKRWVVSFATPLGIVWFGLFGLLYPLGGVLSLFVTVAIISVFNNGGMAFTR